MKDEDNDVNGGIRWMGENEIRGRCWRIVIKGRQSEIRGRCWRIVIKGRQSEWGDNFCLDIVEKEYEGRKWDQICSCL